MAGTKRKASEGGSPATKKKANTLSAGRPTAGIRATRTMALEAARKAVLNTTELLEALVVCLPAKEIFVIQQVSQQFHYLAESSLQIQKKLFIKPCVEKESWVVRGLHRTPRVAHFSSFELVREAKDLTDTIGSPVTPVRFCSYLKANFFDTPTAFRLGISQKERVTFYMGWQA